MSVLGAGDSISCLGILVMFVVGLGLRRSLVLLYTLPLTFIRYIFGSLKDWSLLRTVPVIHMLLSVIGFMMFSISFPWLECLHNSVSALPGFVHSFGGVSFPEWQDCSLPPAVGNIVLGFLLNSSSYEDGISLFFGVVLYIHNAMYGHFFSVGPSSRGP